MSHYKMNYHILAFEVDKLYMQKIDETKIKNIEEHSEFIAQFIESAGWKLEEFIDRYVHEGIKDLLPQNKN